MSEKMTNPYRVDGDEDDIDNYDTGYEEGYAAARGDVAGLIDLARAAGSPPLSGVMAWLEQSGVSRRSP